MRLLLAGYFIRLGFTVEERESGMAALEAAIAGRFDCFILDVSMPGMSGFDCAREMLAIRPDLPIVLTSGYVRPEDEAQAREIGIRAVRSKPAASTAFDGKTIRRPGQCAKMLSPDWL